MEFARFRMGSFFLQARFRERLKSVRQVARFHPPEPGLGKSSSPSYTVVTFEKKYVEFFEPPQK